MNHEPLKNEKNNSKVDEVYHKIKEMIYYNQLAPGQRLVYQDLAIKLHTSTTPIIQALRGLERSNFVIYRPNRGYFVGEITEREAVEFFQLREALEIYILPLALEKLNDRWITELDKVYAHYHEATRPQERRIRMVKDAAFHIKIAECAGNTIIQTHLKDVFEHLYCRYRPEYLWEERVKQADEEHRNILTALKDRNLRRSQVLLKKHIQNGLKYIIKHLAERRNLMIT
jgi:DNA-binding GntR family transcriptional regulator